MRAPNNKIDLKSSEGAAKVIAELISLQPSTTGAVIVAAKGRAPLDLASRQTLRFTSTTSASSYRSTQKNSIRLYWESLILPRCKRFKVGHLTRLARNFLRLVAYTRSSAPFREFLEAKLEKRFEAEEGERTATCQRDR